MTDRMSVDVTSTRRIYVHVVSATTTTRLSPWIRFLLVTLTRWRCGPNMGHLEGSLPNQAATPRCPELTWLTLLRTLPVTMVFINKENDLAAAELVITTPGPSQRISHCLSDRKKRGSDLWPIVGMEIVLRS